MIKEYIIKINENDLTDSGGSKRIEKMDELVRCKDCRWWKNQGTSVNWLPCMEVRTRENWFCGSGKH